ncbi:SURF1 family cytochrome oxidase biogenesis protein [Microbacterium invictum]|nr:MULTISPECIES: SURF1 family cytochrome oxidase biogenesis protein [Microbacterium]
MLRPWWIGMLAVALLVAAVFAWLGQWQLGNAIDTDPPPPGATEQVEPLSDVVAPGEYLPEPLVGQKVSTSGWWLAPDFLVVSSRFNDGVEGFWVTGQLRLWDAAAAAGFGEATPPVSLAVAIAWAPTREAADAAAGEFAAFVNTSDVGAPAELTGRLISDEGPALPPPGAPITEMTRMSSAALLGQWTDTDDLDVYRPYLVADPGTVGLPLPADVAPIDSFAPAESSTVNWLNIFYAVEWAIFAGFAFYMWYRLAKDAWEKELEALEEAPDTGAPGT